MDNRNPGIFALVLWPALLTLAVTIVRLLGEVNGWSPAVFGTPEAGGGKAWVGISWLIFVFGLWFGFRLQRTGRGPKARGKALLVALLAIGVLFGGMKGLQAAGVMWLPDADHPGEPKGFEWMLALLGAACLVAVFAFPRAALVLLVYGVLARLPVVVVTWIAFGKTEWNTHYTKIPPFFTNIAEADRLSFLLMPQATFWPGLTIVMGTAMACLGALLAGRPSAG